MATIKNVLHVPDRNARLQDLFLQNELQDEDQKKYFTIFDAVTFD